MVAFLASALHPTCRELTGRRDTRRPGDPKSSRGRVATRKGAHARPFVKPVATASARAILDGGTANAQHDPGRATAGPAMLL
jgi:hypothetical protein